MAIKKFKPRTPSLRGTALFVSDELTQGNKPEKSLTTGSKSSSGRDTKGRISVRRRGGGHKQKLRTVDFKRMDKQGIPAKVHSIEYDPKRTANIALLFYKDGEKRYIIAPKDLKVGDEIISGPTAPIKVGNTLPLEFIPIGRNIHNIEMHLGKGGQLVRSAGASALLAAIEGDYATVKLPSGEMRLIFKKCCATIGTIGNEDYMNQSIGKAGRSRWLGRRPKVRGVAMNPIDHPHGGGEGKTSGGRHPVSPTGVPTKGYKTRKKNKPSDNFIIKRRK